MNAEVVVFIIEDLILSQMEIFANTSLLKFNVLINLIK